MKRILPLLFLPALAQASLYGTGGTETAVAGTSDVTHMFTSDGTFTLSEAQRVRILLIGGGGAGGTDCGGGGGGGGFLEIAEVEDEKTPDKASAAENEAIREKEGARLLARLPEDAYVIALAIEGKAPDSVELSRKIEALGVAGKSHLCFIIGGSLGLSPKVLARADERLSFSRMTFPHQLMRVILLEQLYRSFRIMRGEPYHK